MSTASRMVLQNGFKCLIVASFLCCGCSSSVDSLSAANTNDGKLPELVSEPVQQFLIETTDAYMLDHEECELAAQRGYSELVRNYARELAFKYNVLIVELRDIALHNNVTLSAEMSPRSHTSFYELEKLYGGDFDDEFLRRIENRFTTDIVNFKNINADDSYLGDKSVVRFAQNRLSNLERHLKDIKDLRKKYRGPVIAKEG